MDPRLKAWDDGGWGGFCRARAGAADRDQWREPNDVIVAFMRSNPDNREDHEVMRGCRVRGIYRTDKYKELVMEITRSAR
ncbi:hypothetical protein G9X64_01075 [Rhizobium sophorae]|uniref:Uncharacterized protein n=1 Tax=Rhizobium sophorae TaxID=1535242 RepID=A0A7Y3WCS7_9HYPH|nr:hypothetical protein [Rhizobium sophorae]NKK74910.1 hypothetical protein [Rhizobium leguminosarum bv. viciae]NNU35126.1 hypothetical protein [Rhizobium sophorae]